MANRRQLTASKRIFAIPPTVRQVGKPPLPDYPNALRWRGTIICVIASFVLTLVCLSMVNTVVQQVSLMVPGAGNVQHADIVAGHNAWRADPRINNAIAGMQMINQRTLATKELNAWSASDRSNSLPSWAALLVELRSTDIKPPVHSTDTQPQAASAPAVIPAEEDKRILDLLSSPAISEPLQLHLVRMRDAFLIALQARGIDIRKAYSLYEQMRWEPSLCAYRPVIRELTDSLVELGNRYRYLNRPSDAARAYSSAIVVLTDCVKDSPLPDVALLAADRLPVALKALDALHITQPTSTAVAKLDQFRHEWLEITDHDINLLPVTFGPTLSCKAHQSILFTMLNSIALLALAWLGAAICLVQFFTIAATRCFGPVPLSWRWGAWGIGLGVVIVALPVIGIITAIQLLPTIWLFSAPSLVAIVLAPIPMALLAVVSGRICIAAAPQARPALPTWAIVGGLLSVLIVAGIAALRVCGHEETWRPPLYVQLFRGSSAFGGLACAVVLVIWAAWGWRRGRCLAVKPGIRARANLALAGPVTAFFLLLAAISLFNNAANDAAHRPLFAQALVDPIADRLGPDWFNTYFQPARNMSDSWRR